MPRTLTIDRPDHDSTLTDPKPTRPRVVIADHDPLARRIVRDMLQSAGVIVVAEAANVRDAIDLAGHYRPDVVLMDATMGGQKDMTAMRTIVTRWPEVRVVGFSVGSDDDELGVLILRAGASGYLSKEIPLESLPRAIHSVMLGEIACSRGFVTRLVQLMRESPAGNIGMRPVKSPLTSREWEILDLLCAELTTDDIADELVLAKETVRTHIKNLLGKLSVRSRADAVALAPLLRNPARDPFDGSTSGELQLIGRGPETGA